VDEGERTSKGHHDQEEQSRDRAFGCISGDGQHASEVMGGGMQRVPSATLLKKIRVGVKMPPTARGPGI